jgi:hypothetical protein
MNSVMMIMFQQVMTQVRAHSEMDTEDTIGCGKCYACVTGGHHPCGLATMFIHASEGTNLYKGAKSDTLDWARPPYIPPCNRKAIHQEVISW